VVPVCSTQGVSTGRSYTSVHVCTSRPVKQLSRQADAMPNAALEWQPPHAHTYTHMNITLGPATQHGGMKSEAATAAESSYSSTKQLQQLQATIINHQMLAHEAHCRGVPCTGQPFPGHPPRSVHPYYPIHTVQVIVRVHKGLHIAPHSFCVTFTTHFTTAGALQVPHDLAIGHCSSLVACVDMRACPTCTPHEVAQVHQGHSTVWTAQAVLEREHKPN